MLDKIMQTSAHNTNKQFEVLEHVSRNIANMNTTGYKNVRFEQYLTPDGQIAGASRRDASQGDLLITRKELDVGIQGAGYIPVTQPDGSVAYTRDGSFALNSQGYLITNHGDLVGDGIQLPLDYQKVEIYEDGTIKVKRKGKERPEEIGQLSLVRFANPDALDNIGYNKLKANPQSGQPMADTDSKIQQGKLERANVNVYAQIDQVLRMNASIISNMRIIKFADDLYRQAVNLRQ